MNRAFHISVCSPPDREKLVAEIEYGERQGVPIERLAKINDLPLSDCETVAEINQESGSLQIELYPRRSGKPWAFSYAEFLEALESAKRRLVGSE